MLTVNSQVDNLKDMLKFSTVFVLGLANIKMLGWGKLFMGMGDKNGFSV